MDERLRRSREDCTMRSKETDSVRVEAKLEQAENNEKDIHHSHSEKTKSTLCVITVRKRNNKIKRSSVPSCKSQQNSLTETLNNDYDQRIQGYTYLMAHCCALLAMKLSHF